jgi:hypothetical protein
MHTFLAPAPASPSSAVLFFVAFFTTSFGACVSGAAVPEDASRPERRGACASSAPSAEVVAAALRGGMDSGERVRVENGVVEVKA